MLIPVCYRVPFKVVAGVGERRCCLWVHDSYPSLSFFAIVVVYLFPAHSAWTMPFISKKFGPLLPCLHWAMLSETDRFLCLQNMDAPQNSPVEFFLSLVSHTLRSESHQHFLAVSQMVQRLQDQRWSTWWVIRSKYPIIKAVVSWISFYWQFKTSLIAYERNWQLMLTSEVELAVDTKIDKDGRDVRFQQQGQHRKENKRDIWSVCRSHSFSTTRIKTLRCALYETLWNSDHPPKTG